MSEFIIYVILLALWSVILFFGKSLGISVILFIIPLLTYLYYLFKKNKVINNKKGLLFMIPIVLLSLTYFIFDNETFAELNFLVIIGLFVLMYIFTIKPIYDIKTIVVEGVTLLFEPISLIGNLFKELGNLFNNRVKIPQNTKRVLKSLLIVLPIAIVVTILLSNADMIFSSIFSGFFDRLRDLLAYRLFDRIVGKIILFVFMFTIIGIHSLYLVKEFSKKREEKEKKIKIRDLFTIKLLFSVLNIIYVVFDFIQIKSLMLHKVAGGFNYATYARQGFFELMIVSLINLSIILISKKLEDKDDNKFIKIMSIVMIFLTLVIIISSFMRMNLYEGAYGYTSLRLFVYVALVTESILLIPTVMYVFNSNFNILKSYMIIIITIYTIINFMNFDYIIANRNINRYYKDNKIDIQYLQNYGADNVKLLYDFYKKTDDENIRKSLSNYFYYLKESKIYNSIFEYNISKDRALDLLKNEKFEVYDYDDYNVDYYGE